MRLKNSSESTMIAMGKRWFTNNKVTPAIIKTGEESELVLGVDEILQHVGDFGRFQKLLLFLVSLLYIPIAFHPFLMYFATLVPSWKCRGNR